MKTVGELVLLSTTRKETKADAPNTNVIPPSSVITLHPALKDTEEMVDGDSNTVPPGGHISAPPPDYSAVSLHIDIRVVAETLDIPNQSFQLKASHG